MGGEPFEVKVVLVGNTSVGKTCIAQMATSGVFGEESSPTLGASYISKLVRLDGRQVDLQIWDTAGQERYRGMTPMYFRGAHVALLAYSVTDADSFAAIDWWLESLGENAEPTVIICLAGNKCDLEAQRMVPTQSGQSKADEVGAMFYEVSAKTGDRIEELFIDLAKAFLEKNGHVEMPNIGDVKIDKSDRPQKKKCC
jgi:Ras-related protein Rab-5C